MATRVAVLVPGIMGSELSVDGSVDGGGTEVLWGEQFWPTYRRLREDPGFLTWSGRVADATLLETVRVGPRKLHLWARLLALLKEFDEFKAADKILKFGYDWRQSLLVSAHKLGQALETREQEIRSQRTNLPNDPPEVSWVFFTHSMGGLVVRVALAQGDIDPDSVDRIVHAGSPLLGAPGAFGSAYHKGALPGIKTWLSLLRISNRDRFFLNFLQAIRSFPSVYQLMPPVQNRYLKLYGSGHQFNPFEPSEAHRISPAMVDHAKEAHELFLRAEKMRLELNIPTYTLYGSDHVKHKTDVGYCVTEAPPNPDPHSYPGYNVWKQPKRSRYGDGTVPVESAAGGPGSWPHALVDVDHATMYDNVVVVRRIKTAVI